MFENKKFFIKTHGCQMNEYDSEKLSDILKYNLKMSQTINLEEADILFLNTCSIREKAQEKVFSELGRWKKFKIKKPNTLIAVGGCVAAQEGENLKSRSPQVDIIFGPQTIHRLPKMIRQAYSLNKKLTDVSFPEIEKFDFLPKSTNKTPSAYVSIMEGCSKYCTFCIVPYTRGEEVNRRFDDILHEVYSLSKLGTKEIILLGQNVNAYKSKMNDGDDADLASLIKHISHIDEIQRIRYTTSHPIDFSENLINEYNNFKLANNLHLPIQSGSDKILLKMKRKHTVLEYKSIIKKVRELRPNISLTSDFIVGYPGETNDDFEDTLNLVEDLKFDDGYSFIYSPRPGTPAMYEKDNIQDSIKKKRLQQLQQLLKSMNREYANRILGTEEKILVEGYSKRNKSELFGRTSSNKVVNFNGLSDLIGKFVNVEIIEIKSTTLRGKFLNLSESTNL
ncbi:MAG: tRNA (N6-isopentenyl adenosine(37)-C2)-methylthiotransferase MiaB [Pseudomonadota bacterium]|nr:tRNA (N6-isopentenyl adenosine(37)-C2)-methylthiotransferase MiaB [Pseudomonadota bacterium]